jgi:hypothetical protein
MKKEESKKKNDDFMHILPEIKKHGIIALVKE